MRRWEERQLEILLPLSLFEAMFSGSAAFPDDASSCGAGLHASLLPWLQETISSPGRFRANSFP